MRRLLASRAAAAALTMSPAAARAQGKNAGKPHVRHILVSVTDAEGAPVDGLTLDHRNLTNCYAVDIQSDSDVAAIDVAVAREGVRLQISNSRR